MDILLDPRNKPAGEFFIFLKIQDGCRRSKICEALYFCGSYKLMGQLITGCLNWMKGICLQNKNVISGVKFCQFFSFDRQRPSWILRKIKNAYSSLWVRSSSMSVPNFVKIRWTGRICWAKMWFVGSNLVDFWSLTFGDHFEFWEMSKTLILDY